MSRFAEKQLVYIYRAKVKSHCTESKTLNCKWLNVSRALLSFLSLYPLFHFTFENKKLPLPSTGLKKNKKHGLSKNKQYTCMTDGSTHTVKIFIHTRREHKHHCCPYLVLHSQLTNNNVCLTVNTTMTM